MERYSRQLPGVDSVLEPSSRQLPGVDQILEPSPPYLSIDLKIMNTILFPLKSKPLKRNKTRKTSLVDQHTQRSAELYVVYVS